MPLEIHKLENLQTLTKFIVAKNGGLALRHLKDLSNLQGKLSIENLENVEDIQDAREADLEKKKGLEQLSLQWTSNMFTGPRNNESNEKQVLNHLQPHRHLEKLTIAGYSGIEFSCWMSHPSSLSWLTFMELRDCKKCGLLPSVGRLPSLKKLIINRLEALLVVGVEFYGNDYASGESFPTLEKLEFRHMLAWEAWSSDNGSGDECGRTFPKLRELVISDCPRLHGELPSYLPALRILTIDQCPQLTASIKSLPSLEELDLNGCKAVVFKNSVNLTSLTRLSMRSIAEQGRSLVEAFTQVAIAPKEVNVDMNCLNLLIDGNGKLMEMMHLEKLVIGSYESRQRLKMSRMGGCKRLESFSLGNLPATLEVIAILNCSNLRVLTRGKGDDRDKVPLVLGELIISGCESLESFPERILEAAKYVSIEDCPNLEIPPSIWLLNLTRLGHLSIGGFDHWESFPANVMSFPNLKALFMYRNKNLKSLPNALHKLGFLEKLVIMECRSIEMFPEGGFPPNLLELTVDCENMKQPITEWGLDKLHCLHHFEIHHICPPHGLLPSSLKLFHMYEVKELESIPKDLLRNLTTLTSFWLYDCPKLTYFPEDLYLPSTLEELRIWRCPYLEDKCRHGGRYWHLLTDIPLLNI